MGYLPYLSTGLLDDGLMIRRFSSFAMWLFWHPNNKFGIEDFLREHFSYLIIVVTIHRFLR